MNEIKTIDRYRIKSYFKSPYNIRELLIYIDELDSKYEYKYKNINIIVYYRKHKDEPDFDLIRKVVMRGSEVISNKNFSIFLFLSPLRKEFNDDNSELDIKNINSGFTYTTRNEIYIFRKEEFPKVIIHELIHHDRNIDNQYIKPANKTALLSHFNLTSNSNIILNEAIVELWATIIHLSFVSKEYGIDLTTLIKTELEYSLFKCHQISLLRQKDKYYDKCNIYGYIIFKTIFLYYFSEFKDIYTFPYNDTKLTKFLLSHSHIKEVKTNPLFILNKRVIQRSPKSLSFMLLSDL